MTCPEQPAILVVEDNASLRRLVVRVLNAAGFETVDEERAADALAAVRQRRGAFDLAIVDLVMPGMSGLDLGTDLDREYPDLKILYISGYVNSLAADALARRSPDQVLLKPFSGEALLERVRSLLESSVRREHGTLG